MRRAQTFNEAAAGIGTRPPDQPVSSPDPHACAAHGCPIWGSVITDGARLCFVHALIANRRRAWDATTARLRNRTGLIEVVRHLRGGGGPDATDEQVLARARSMLPDLGTVPNRYRALALVERTLIDECIDRDDPLFANPDAVVEARSQIAALADRFARRPVADPMTDDHGADR